jgi:hypothetical protein
VSIRSTSLKAFLIRFLQEKDKPCYLIDIYGEVAAKLGKKDSVSFRAQIRGVFNASIKINEGIFRRVSNVKGLYSICDGETEIEKYIKEVDKEDQECNDSTTREDAMHIYNNFTKLAYLEANKMHGTSCIVPLDELHSACQIGLYKGACAYRPSKAKSDGNSPIPYLKSYIRGFLLNVIREQKTWNSRNLRVHDDNVSNVLNVDSIDDLPDKNVDFTDEISISELKNVLINEMRQHLNDDEFDVMVKRWGLDGDGAKTFREIGQEVCTKKDKLRNNESAKSWSWQIEKKARNKLKRNSLLLKNLFDSYCG